MSQHDVLMLDAVINMVKLYADALNAIASVEKVSGRRADELLRELPSPAKSCEAESETVT
jgi:hypothetical protein